MINAPQLLADLKRRLTSLEADLRERISTVPSLEAALLAEWQSARDANRNAETFESWVEQVITQAGVHWLLSCVFLRFIEDNALIERPWIAGTAEGGRLNLARDRHEAYFRVHPLESDREYLIACFVEAGKLPGLHTFFDEAHNPVFRLGISGDAAMGLRQFWQQQDPNTGALVHDFTDATWNTRFLGDLYQDLSEATRKRYALLQTPEFVEEFILDRTLTPAIREFGYRETRMIDPTCGSGHFLLGGFQRMVDEWSRAEPTRNRRDVAQKALDAVCGVDLNPFAVAISRFRLLLAALKTSGIHRLSEAPDFHLNVAIGDSLLHGQRFGLSGQSGIRSDSLFDAAESHNSTGLAHAYASEDLVDVQRILSRQYHAVVGNPPYIVVRDAALNAAYRNQYASCHMKYSLGAPFTERFFELAVTGGHDSSAGYVGLITANSFMKREFGRKLIEHVLPRLDLTHVVDTQGAYIPGHGTPTVILFGRHRTPFTSSVRTVMGIKGEPITPADPAHGLVWSAILNQIDNVGSESIFASVADMDRTVFGKHPWSIGGGGVAEVKEAIEAAGTETFGIRTTAMGFFGISAADEIMLADAASFRRRGVELEYTRPLISGDEVRDWSAITEKHTLFPYDTDNLIQISEIPGVHRWLWPCRTYLGSRTTFAKCTYFEEGRPWWEWHQIALDRIKSPFTITFAEIATHNHFIIDRGGKVFNRTSPIIKLSEDATEDEYFARVAILNSSVACFWMKQVSHQKQMMGGDGIRISEKSKVPYQFASTRLRELPLPLNWRKHDLYPKLVQLARKADALALLIAEPSSTMVIQKGIDNHTSIAATWQDVETSRSLSRSQIVLVQEEIDFLCYHIYGLTNDLSLLSSSSDWTDVVTAGSRPFCILSQTNVDGHSVPLEVPINWTNDLRALWTKRMREIEENSHLRAIEDPHYKRRWIGRQGLFNHGANSDEFRTALHDWLVARLESERYWEVSSTRPPQLTSTSRLADIAYRDSDFMTVATLYAGHADFDIVQLVTKLVTTESVPFLPMLRFSESGLRKYEQWKNTWTLQRKEDDGEVVGVIPPPPTYQGKDFLKTDIWRLRGGLDVPKERWISYPGCERGVDGSLVIAWAGWNHLQQATAIAGYYLEMKDNEGWTPERLQVLLAGLLELLPWLNQWHNEVDPVYGERMGSYYHGFVVEEARTLGFTLDDLRNWTPPKVAAKRGRKTKT